MREVSVENIDILYAANDNGIDSSISVQPELTPNMRGKKIGFGIDKALDKVIKSFPFEKEMLSGLLFDKNRLQFYGMQSIEAEDLIKRMEDSVFETNFMRLKWKFPSFEPNPEVDSLDPLASLSDEDREDFKLMANGKLDYRDMESDNDNDFNP